MASRCDGDGPERLATYIHSKLLIVDAASGALTADLGGIEGLV
jgi:hypothetical protein